MQTTRLHISGLTPSISATDLKQRFSTFGKVQNVDGVGKLDGVGMPRKFAYLTLETTQPKLARCMNLLSGSTWKGAKLRIGEAKPDYKARHEREINPPPPAPRPKLSAEARRRARLKFRLRARRLSRGAQGKQLKDMSIVTLDNVSKRKGWRRTPLNHLIRPMRMRPLHPIPSLRTKHVPSKIKLKEKLAKRKFALTRARCTIIDPARYGAVHLKDGDGLLGAEVVAVGRDEEEREPESPREEKVVVAQESDEESSRSSTPAPTISQPTTTPTVSKPAPILPQTAPAPQPLEKEDPLSLAHEKSSTLALLGGMFGKGEWGGRESVSGDEMDVMEAEGEGEVGGDEMDVMEAEGEGEVGYEVVPRAASEAAEDTGVEDNEEEAGEDEDMTSEEAAAEEQEDGADGTDEEQEEQESPIKLSSLKDMFKPQEESTGFSLGLDIELDPDAESFLPASISAPLPEPTPVVAPAPIQTEKHAHTIQFTPDPKAPLFFPGGRNDIFYVIAEKGWEWPHPGIPEEIRAKWDKNKADLTREYTRRHREAVKRRRRGGGTKGDDA
ncbi:unnamed protein product [Rhizoctonia solani]|uniref:RRM domain-containing protein n=1 Tax=Rhizoctonia solani TaxID=456999 RepID=A0A8H3GTS9_9AGAM|nr:unnamed protein product [Rhizoctonia solani]